MFGDSITTGQAVIVCVFSLVVVFAVLLAISYLIDLIAFILSRAEGRKAQPGQTAEQPAQAARPAASSDEAVLTAAAIAAYLGTQPDRLVVRSIRRVTDEQTPWCQAGRADSLQ